MICGEITGKQKVKLSFSLNLPKQSSQSAKLKLVMLLFFSLAPCQVLLCTGENVAEFLMLPAFIMFKGRDTHDKETISG